MVGRSNSRLCRPPQIDGIDCTAYDTSAELVFIESVAASSDPLEEYHVTQTECADIQIADARRRRRLADFADASVVLTIFCTMPATSAVEIATTVIDELNAAIDDGSLLALLVTSSLSSACVTPRAAPPPLPSANVACRGMR